MKNWIFFSILSISLSAASQNPRVENSGILAIWYSGKEEVLGLPWIIGGQVMVQWEDVEPEEGQYDFSLIGEKIDALQAIGKIASLQVNGNNKPAWLFQKVPWIPEKLSVQIKDSLGSLMYWHPAYRQAYENIIIALGDYLQDRGRDFLGVRMNYNAFGTEHTFLEDGTYRIAANWNYPEGTESGVDWSVMIRDEYEMIIREAYIREISPHTPVFIRNGVDTKAYTELDTSFREGRLSLFHTSSESEPHSSSTEKQYINFYNYCRSGYTTAYAEPWASSLGHHGGQTDDRTASMPQWFYWRLLLDLHCGVSHIAVYANDLKVAETGQYLLNGIIYHDDLRDGTNYRTEFREALDFASEYAGYHASPEVSPGAWIAFRGNELIRNENSLPEQKRKLEFLTSDYDFLMHRLPDHSVPLDLTGPPGQRYGSWARKLPADENMVLIPDTSFIQSLDNVVLKIIWLDDPGSGIIEIRAGHHSFLIRPEGTGEWKISELILPDNNFEKLEIKALCEDVILHMVEFERTTE